MALRPNRVLLITFLLLWFLPCSLSAADPPIPDQPVNYVMDLAGIIDPQTEADLNRRLKELEDKTTAQVVVLTLNSLEGEPIETVSLRTAERWALGQKGKDNGVLITVAVQDRKYRIEVGYGLEAILPDSLVGTIGRDCFVPNFRKGKYSEGISGALKTITKNIIGVEVGKITEPIKKKINEPIKAIGTREQEVAMSRKIIDTEEQGIIKSINKSMNFKERSLYEKPFYLIIFYFVIGLILIVLLFPLMVFLFTSDESERRSSKKSSGGSWGGSGSGGFGGGGFGGFSGGGGGFGGGGISGSW